MSIKLLGLASLIATCFVSWPIVGKSLGVNGAWVGTIALGVTGITVAIFSGKQLALESLLGIKAIVCLIFFGALNGLGCYLYSLKTSEPNIQIGFFVSVVSVFMVILSPLIAMLLNSGAAINFKQVCGMAIACLAIYLISC